MMTCACCAFRKVKKGLWSPDEDQMLTDFVSKHGIKRWSQVPLQAGLERCGKSCRLRWLNYLRPGIKRGQFSPEEQQLIVELQALYGNRWSWIAQWIPGRTDNEIKNFWNVHMGTRKCKRTITFDHVSSYRLAVPFKLELCEPKLLEPQIQTEAPMPVQQDNAYSTHSSPTSMDNFGLDDMILDATVEHCMNWSHIFMQPDHLLPLH